MKLPTKKNLAKWGVAFLGLLLIGWHEAVLATEAGGWGTIISCIPGRLAYYYDECGDRRMLLKRAVEKKSEKL